MSPKKVPFSALFLTRKFVQTKTGVLKKGIVYYLLWKKGHSGFRYFDQQPGELDVVKTKCFSSMDKFLLGLFFECNLKATNTDTWLTPNVAHSLAALFFHFEVIANQASSLFWRQGLKILDGGPRITKRWLNEQAALFRVAGKLEGRF